MRQELRLNAQQVQETLGIEHAEIFGGDRALESICFSIDRSRSTAEREAVDIQFRLSVRNSNSASPEVMEHEARLLLLKLERALIDIAGYPEISRGGEMVPFELIPESPNTTFSLNGRVMELPENWKEL